jgi:HemY protein
MRRLIFISVLALVVGAALWYLVQQDPGYILIVVAGKTIEMRFAFAVVMVALVAVLWVWLRRLLRRSLGVLRGDWRFVANRGARLAEQRTRRGLLHYMEGDWHNARRELLKAARRLPDPLLHYLVAADSAQHMGQSQQARDLLVQAEQTAQRRPLSVAVNLARLQLAEGQYQDCLATLHRTRTQAPTNATVLALLRKAYAAVADWASMELLLPDLQQHKVLPAAEFEQLEQQVYVHLLSQAGNGLGEANPEASFKNIDEIWRRMPKSLHQKPALVNTYARCLLLVGRHDLTESLLRQTLKHQWSETLVELYGLTFADNRQVQLHTAQRWLEQHADDAALHLTLGRLCLRNQLWGQAKDHLQQSLKLRPSPAAYAELARLLASLGEHKASLDAYQQGLLLTTHGLPELPLPSVSAR